MLRAQPVALLAFLVLSGLLLSSCSAFRAIMPGGVSPSDAEWSGVKTAEVVSVAASLDPRVSAIESVLDLLGNGGGNQLTSALGVLMPVGIKGETSPRWVLCVDEFASKCAAIPINSKVNFAGKPLGPGLVWKPSRLTVD